MGRLIRLAFRVKNWIRLGLIKTKTRWLRFKRYDLVVGKLLFLLIAILSIWTGIVLGQYLQNRSVRDEIARAYLHASTVTEENGWLRSERRAYAQKIIDLETELGLKKKVVKK